MACEGWHVGQTVNRCGGWYGWYVGQTVDTGKDSRGTDSRHIDRHAGQIVKDVWGCMWDRQSTHSPSCRADSQCVACGTDSRHRAIHGGSGQKTVEAVEGQTVDT